MDDDPEEIDGYAKKGVRKIETSFMNITPRPEARLARLECKTYSRNTRAVGERALAQ